MVWEREEPERLEESRAERERSRLDMGSRLNMASAICDREETSRRQRTEKQ